MSFELRPLFESSNLPVKATASQERYHGARVTPLNNAWVPEHISGDAAYEEAFEVMTPRIRDLIQNTPIFKKAMSTLATLTIGTGLQPFAAATNVEEEPLDDTERFEIESDTWFARWVEGECDAERNLSHWDMQELAFREMCTVGNVLIRECFDMDPKRISPLCYQVIPWEQIDRTMDRGSLSSGENRIHNGIEYDSQNRKVAIWIYDAHPFDGSYDYSINLQSTRIPIDELIHLYRPLESATVGESWFVANVQGNRDFDRTIANRVTSESINSLLTFAMKTRDPAGNNPPMANRDQYGRPRFQAGYPAFFSMGPNDSVEVIESHKGYGDLGALADLLMNLQAMGCRISKHRLIGAAEKANLATIKATNQDDESMVAPIQQHQSISHVIPVRRRFDELAVARGLYRSVTAKEYEDHRHKLRTIEVIPSRRPDTEPKADGEAAIDRIRSGRTHYAYECARLGMHWRHNLRWIERINNECERRGIALALDKGQGGETTKTTTIARDEEEESNAA